MAELVEAECPSCGAGNTVERDPLPKRCWSCGRTFYAPPPP